MSDKLAETVNHEETIKLLKELSMLSYLQESEDEDSARQKNNKAGQMAKTQVRTTKRENEAWKTGYDGFGNKQ